MLGGCGYDCGFNGGYDSSGSFRRVAHMRSTCAGALASACSWPAYARALLAFWKQPCRHPLRAYIMDRLRTRRCILPCFHASMLPCLRRCVHACFHASVDAACMPRCVLPCILARVPLGTELRACAHASMCVVASSMRVRRSRVEARMRGITECVRMQVCARRSACDRMHSRACLYVVQFVSMLV